MKTHHVALAALALSVLASAALAAGPAMFVPRGHGPSSKDHTPLLEQCAAYQKEFSAAIKDRPPSAKVVEAQRLDREGLRMCDMQGARVTQGVNDIAEALEMIGVQPTL